MLTLYIADAEKDVSMKNLSPKEAIAILSDMKIDIPVPKAAVTQIKRNLALDMAINALNCSEIPNNSDTIYRQQAIDEITEYGFGNTIYMSVAELKRRIEQLPSAQPERRTAYWTKDIVGSVVCSNCGGIREDNRIGHTQWCNCCGCFMRGEEND